ncbi:MAG: hypothetical protein ACR2PA_07305 [Hyphomicrobiaceae bacterium]
MTTIPVPTRTTAKILVISAIAMVQVAATALMFDGMAAKTTKRSPAATVEFDVEKLPTPVAEMRDAILEAAYSGKIKQLLVPIQWNELKPDFGDIPGDKLLESFKQRSIDGEGREILAILIELLNSPYAVIRQGPDIENNKVYVWPYFAEVPLTKLPPPQQIQLLRIVPRDRYKAMISAGRYSYWRLSIGADGTWHSFLTDPK